MKDFFTQTVQMIPLTARLYYIAKLSKAIKWLKIKLPLSCQICPVIDGGLTVECPISSIPGTNGSCAGKYSGYCYLSISDMLVVFFVCHFSTICVNVWYVYLLFKVTCTVLSCHH